MDNYGTQANPGTEEQDMGKVREIFDRALNAMVEASKLADEVRSMRGELDQLKHDIDYVRARNRELDNMLNDVRQQRDNAQRELGEAKDRLSVATNDLQAAHNANESYNRRINELEQGIAQARKERDDYGLEALKLREELDQAKSRLADIQDFAKRMFPPEPSKQEPVQTSYGAGGSQGHGEVQAGDPVGGPATLTPTEKPWWERS